MLLILKSMNGIYENEDKKADDSVRREKFGSLEARIGATAKRLVENEKLKSLKTAGNVPAIGAGRVKSLAAFHQTRIDAGAKSDGLSNELIELRQWLSRQGAHLTVDGRVIWRTSQARVLWDTELQQLATKVTLRGGLLYTADGKPLDTRRMVTHFSGPGYAIYVMSAEGNLHVSTHSAGQRHHSSLLAGAPVAGAGEVRVSHGALQEISNKSGHYWPETFHLVQVLKQLFEYGLADTGYQVVARDGKKAVYASAREFIEAEDVPSFAPPEPLKDSPYGSDSDDDDE